jgi:hypothetical protein
MSLLMLSSYLRSRLWFVSPPSGVVAFHSSLRLLHAQYIEISSDITLRRDSSGIKLTIYRLADLSLIPDMEFPFANASPSNSVAVRDASAMNTMCKATEADGTIYFSAWIRCIKIIYSSKCFSLQDWRSGSVNSLVICVGFINAIGDFDSVQRQRLAFPIRPTWVGSTWRRRQNPVSESETSCFK